MCVKKHSSHVKTGGLASYLLTQEVLNHGNHMDNHPGRTMREVLSLSPDPARPAPPQLLLSMLGVTDNAASIRGPRLMPPQLKTVGLCCISQVLAAGSPWVDIRDRTLHCWLLDGTHWEMAVPRFTFSLFFIPSPSPTFLPILFPSLPFPSFFVCRESQIHDFMITAIFWFWTIDFKPLTYVFHHPASSSHLI